MSCSSIQCCCFVQPSVLQSLQNITPEGFNSIIERLQDRFSLLEQQERKQLLKKYPQLKEAGKHSIECDYFKKNILKTQQVVNEAKFFWGFKPLSQLIEHPKVNSLRTVEGARNIVSIYSAEHKKKLPGYIVYKKGKIYDHEKMKDEAVQKALNSIVSFVVFMAVIFDRKSLDNESMNISVVVNFGKKFVNAYWDGFYLCFGNGDGKIFFDFTDDEEIMAHEAVHAITDFTAQLVYKNQSGALNEHISDAFAVMFDQHKRKVNVDDEDQHINGWQVGDWLVAGPYPDRSALRSLKAPGTAFNIPEIGKDDQVATADLYTIEKEDNGGVHKFSGIPNFAFYTFCIALAKLSFADPYLQKQAKYSWGIAGNIWYKTLTNGELKPNSTFLDFANATINISKKLYKENPKVTESLISAWRSAKINL